MKRYRILSRETERNAFSIEADKVTLTGFISPRLRFYRNGKVVSCWNWDKITGYAEIEPLPTRKANETCSAKVMV